MRFLTLLLVWITSLSCFAQVNSVLLKKANNGLVDAQIELAKYYLEENDYSEAVKWYEKAAQNNSLEAMQACGYWYCFGYEEPLALYFSPDFVKGIYWLKRAAAKGDLDAKDFLTSFIATEEISRECPFDWMPFDEDLERYLELKDNITRIKEEYNNKNAIAAYYLAIISFAEKDYTKAISYLKEAYPIVMEPSVIRGTKQYPFNDILDKREDLLDMEGTIAVKVFSLLGWCYEFGIGVDIDNINAAEYYLSDFNYMDYSIPTIPRIRAAYCYKKAGLYDKFIEQANSQGIIWNIRKDIIRHVPCLRLELAEMYKRGDGVIKDKHKALEIYEEIADWRNSDMFTNWNYEIISYPDIARAAYRAYKMYQSGEGCKIDNDMANLYFELALKYGDKNAWYEKEHE